VELRNEMNRTADEEEAGSEHETVKIKAIPITGRGHL
jgi:hypothetical protein